MDNGFIDKGLALKFLCEYVVYKAKTYGQNSVTDKHKASCYLSMSHDFKSFNNARHFIYDCVKLGIVSCNNLRFAVKYVEYFIQRDGYSNPNADKEI